MPTPTEYALFAANSYAAAPNEAVVSNINELPIANGWTQTDEGVNNDTGFLARAYRNGSDVIVAYGGTTAEEGMTTRDWFNGNLPGALGTSLGEQVVDAAKFYLDVLARNPTANITFTGHSLGGGLAALMGVFFGRQATTFDQAPFAKSANSATVVNDLKSRLISLGYELPEDLITYVPGQSLATRRELVSQTFLRGEALQFLTNRALLGFAGLALGGPAGVLLTQALAPSVIAGTGQSTQVDAGTSVNAINLHSMVLLTAALLSPAFREASRTNPELLQQIFTSGLNFNQSDRDNRNLLHLLTQHQAIGNAALDVFAADLAKFTGTLNPGDANTLKSALYQLAIGLHYGRGENNIDVSGIPFDPLINSLAGGVQFTPDPARRDEYQAALSKVLQELGLYIPDARPFLKGTAERYTLPTSGGLVAPANVDGKSDLMVGGNQADDLAGGGGNDVLVGRPGADRLDGGIGEDTLYGGADNDVLTGGEGVDTYVYFSGDGADTILDEGVNRIRYNNKLLSGLFLKDEVSGVYKLVGDNGKTITINSPAVLTLDGNTQITFQNQTTEDALDDSFRLRLHSETSGPITDRTIVGDLAPVDFDPAAPGIQTRVDDLGNVITDPSQPQPNRADTLFDSPGNDLIQGFGGTDLIDAFRGGDDKLDGGAGRDIVSGRAGDDIVIGGTEGDLLRGDAGKDKLFGESEITVTAAIAAQGAPGTGLRGDFMDGGIGDDTLISGANNDALNGGSGEDLILGGGGNDDVDGDLETSIVSLDWSVTRQVIVQDGVTIYNRTYNNIGFNSTSPGGDDIVFGGGGEDWLFTREGDDYIDGGADDDVVFGEAGSDDVFGGSGNDKLFGDSASVPLTQHGQDYLDGGDGDDEMNGDGGDDILLGGQGNDQMFGDSTLDAGNDYLDGEAGDDQILGVAGDDQIVGGDGTDFLQGDSGTGINDGNDTIDGGAGADTILGEGGDDRLAGGDGNDVVFGEAGLDTISGGAGEDQLVGDEGDGVNGAADIIDGGDGNDLVFGDGGDDVIVGGAGVDQLQGGMGNDTLDGGADNDVLFGEVGNDTLNGGGGSDQLLGGFGDDALVGGDGDDVYFYSLGDGRDHISDSGGTDFLVFTNLFATNLRLDVGSLEIVLPDGGQVHLDDFDPDNPLAGSIEFFQFADGNVLTRQQLIQSLGFQLRGTPGDDSLSGTALGDSIQAFAGNDFVFGAAGNDSIDLGGGDDWAEGGDGNDVMLGGDGNDVLSGGSGVDQLAGGTGNDLLGGGAGNDLTLDGGAGNDTYLFGTGDGQDVAVDTAGINGIQLLGGLTANQVTLQRAGNDLLVLLNGTTDRFTARDWFANPANWNQLGLGDGTVLDRAGVQARLVQNQAPVLTTDTASTFEDNLLPVSGNALANDFDPEGRALSVTTTGTRAGTYGSLTLQSTGSFSYNLNNASTAVQSLAQGQTVSDAFTYTATDNDPAGAATASSTITVNIAGRNDAPVANADSAFVSEDGNTLTFGNVLGNDTDVDNGAVLRVAAPGMLQGTYGTLNLAQNGEFSYSLRNDSTAVQSLGQNVEAIDTFTYAASDGALQTSAQLQVFVAGANDVPVVSVPLADQSVSAGRSFNYTIPLGSFTDVDAGDVLTYSASLADGAPLPSWLTFNGATRTFSGSSPREATGFIDIEVEVTDGHSEENSDGVFESSATDVFRLTFEASGGGGGGGGGGNGNEGVGNGEDAPPPGHSDNFNDGPGTGPGHPGAQGGNGIGHTAPSLRSIGDSPQRQHVQAGAARRVAGSDHGHGGGNGNAYANGQGGSDGGTSASMLADGSANGSGASGAPTTEESANEPVSDDALAARLAADPRYEFNALFDWLTNESSASETLDASEIARRWNRVASYASESSNGLSDQAHAAAFGWQRFADEFAAANGNSPTSFGQFVGLGVASGLPNLETFRGLNEGMARL